MVDHTGAIVDGDQLIYIIAKARAAARALPGPVVGTVMSNLGLELGLRELGVDFRRAQVGDRYVLAMLKDTGGVLGGESSGHLLCLDKTTTGDAMVAALQVLAVMRESGQTLAQLAAGMVKMPQVMVNVRVAQRFDPSASPKVRDAVQAVEARLAGAGRVVLRASGTEPVIRVMVEGRDQPTTAAMANELADAVRRAAA
jgi:phosphoglucosamine mutase